MPPRETYRIESRESSGYGAVIAGNFVEITPRLNRFRASVQAYNYDPNEQHKQSDTAEAAAWAAAIARTHKGKPDDAFKPAERWEIMDGCSIAAHRLEYGGYESNRRRALKKQPAGQGNRPDAGATPDSTRHRRDRPDRAPGWSLLQCRLTSRSPSTKVESQRRGRGKYAVAPSLPDVQLRNSRLRRHHRRQLRRHRAGFRRIPRHRASLSP